MAYGEGYVGKSTTNRDHSTYGEAYVGKSITKLIQLKADV